MKTSIFLIILLSSYVSFILSFPFIANAEIVQLTVVPSAWKLENYLNTNLVVWYAGSSCSNGKITFSSGVSIDDKNMFWSTVMAAKVSKQKLFVRYDDSTSNCNIASFGLPQD